MTTAGWIIMLGSVSAVTLLFTWSLYRVLSHKADAEKLHGIEDIAPDDLDKD
jgi:hypothetical protein